MITQSMIATVATDFQMYERWISKKYLSLFNNRQNILQHTYVAVVGLTLKVRN